MMRYPCRNACVTVRNIKKGKENTQASCTTGTA